ncbi:hypothetical protein L6164_016619 [Bauhinia variegata]|uniref:Uncharacterized protein n=1 Tax=Bauhinia variegata TaxID=167791 RepID=A0ACB9NP79_BAUVA|nr:hypothetical protein L6164_016619 [Bauhinia variegata]
MKTLFLILSLFLVAITTNAEPVLDITGEPLIPGAQYYILPIVWGAGGGGLRPGKAGNSTNPVNVLKAFSDFDLGEPVKFTTVPKLGLIPTDTLLHIKFEKTPEGVSSGNWITVKDLGETWTVGIGGPQDHEGYETLSGFFKIHKLGHAYKLSFVPYINTALSADIGTSIDNDRNWRLVVTSEQPYPVLFRKAVPTSFGI